MAKIKDSAKLNAISVETEFDIEFYELDPMRIVWHGNYFNYFERARRALLEKIGYGYQEMAASGYAFPVVTISAKYISSFKLGDRAIARATLDEYENCIIIKYEIYNAKTRMVYTRGVSKQMAFDVNAGESCFSCPDIFIKKVEKLLNEGNGGAALNPPEKDNSGDEP